MHCSNKVQTKRESPQDLPTSLSHYKTDELVPTEQEDFKLSSRGF